MKKSNNKIFSLLNSLMLISFATFSIFTFSCGGEEKKTSSKSSSEIRSSVDSILRSEPVTVTSEEAASMMGTKGLMIVDSKDCGTRVNLSDYDEIVRSFDNVCNPENIPDDNTRLIVFPVYLINVGNNRENATNEREFNDALHFLNVKFEGCRIRFELRGSQVLNSEQLFDFKTSDERMLTAHKRDGMINVYVVNSIEVEDGARVNGYTASVRNYDNIFMSGESIQNRSTLAHEMGHYYLLYHTHGKTNLGTTDELVNGNNCSCTGDDVCDTPADPNLYSFSLVNCVFNDVVTDRNGHSYRPDPTNMMSYGFQCRNIFTEGQYRRMRWAALKFRNYLTN